VSVLATSSGRQFLTADLRKRIRRAIQEIQRDEREELEDMLNSSDVGDLN
jgi:cytidylate kinase